MGWAWNRPEPLPIAGVDKTPESEDHAQCVQAFGSCSNIDDSETFKILQISNRREALIRLMPFSYF
jgi:hypothetical protein